MVDGLFDAKSTIWPAVGQFRRLLLLDDDIPSLR
jgi:hypothetical protein